MAQLNFKKYGEGEPIIIMHGLYGSSDNWISIARELMLNFAVYILDLRNHGASPHIPDHNYQVMTDDLVEFMNDKGIYSAIIMGHSMGGKVAMFFTAMHPERVKKLIIVDMSPRSYEFDKGDKQYAEHQKILAAMGSIDLTKIGLRSEVDQKLSQSITSIRIRQFLLKNIKRNKAGGFRWIINLDVLKQSLPSILVGLEDEKDELKLYLNPALFIKGALSEYIQSKDEHMIKQFFTHVQIVTINNASHWVHAEQPEEFLLTVKKFIYG